MAGTPDTRSLIAFAFVKHEFDRSRDIVQGLMPLFAPAFQAMAGQNFSPKKFCSHVETLYGLRMHPWVAEDWAVRFEQAGFLIGEGDQYSRTYKVAVDFPGAADESGIDIANILNQLVDYVFGRLAAHPITISRAEVEAGIISRLKTVEFLNLLLKPDAARRIGKTLSLSPAGAATKPDPEAILDYLLASRLLGLSRQEPRTFEQVAQVAAGVLVSEVVLSLRDPPKVGQQAAGGMVFFDSPFIIDLLDLADSEQHAYSTQVLDDFKKLNLYLRVFSHNVEEIRRILVATLDGYGDIRAASGTVAFRLRTDSTALSRAQVARGNLTKKVEALGIKVVDMESTTRPLEKSFPDGEIDDLISHIRPWKDIYSREVDAQSVAGVARHVLSKKSVASVLSLSALFVTKNRSLSNFANRTLRERYNYHEDAAPPFLTDRQAAGLLWLALGGESGELSRTQLLANCSRVVTPRRDVMATVSRLLEQVDAASARDFEILMSEERCAHYVMDTTLGDAFLATEDNALHILEQVKRIAVDDVKKEEADRYGQKVAALSEIHAIQTQEMESEHAAYRYQAEIDQANIIGELNDRIILQEREIQERRIRLEEEVAQREAQADQLAASDVSINDLQRSVLISCVDAGRQRERNLRTGIIFLVSILLGVLGAGANVVFSLVHGLTLMVSLAAAYVVISSILSFILGWTIPEQIFGRALRTQGEKVFRAEVRRRGAASYLANWECDLSSGNVTRR